MNARKHPRPNQAQNSTADALVLAIAQRILGLETLETRHSDRLDFHELGVGQLKQALLAAYEAGRNSKK